MSTSLWTLFGVLDNIERRWQHWYIHQWQHWYIHQQYWSLVLVSHTTCLALYRVNVTTRIIASTLCFGISDNVVGESPWLNVWTKFSFIRGCWHSIEIIGEYSWLKHSRLMALYRSLSCVSLFCLPSNTFLKITKIFTKLMHYLLIIIKIYFSKYRII